MNDTIRPVLAPLTARGGGAGERPMTARKGGF